MLHSCPYKQDLVSYCKESIDCKALEVLKLKAKLNCYAQ